MNLKEQLTEKKAALLELEPQLKADDVTEEIAAQGEALASEIKELEKKIETAEKAAQVLKSIGSSSDNTKSDTEEKDMSVIDEFTKKAAEITDRKTGASVHLDEKAYNTVVTAPQIADVDRSIAPQPSRVSAASLFTNAVISGNAITYFLQGAFQTNSGIEPTAQGNKKPQASTSFAGTTLALSKLAAYIKETDEILDDASFLASEVQNTLIYQLGKVEDDFIVNAIANTSGVLTDDYTDLADGILAAITAVKSHSAYSASIVIMNPVDLMTLLTSKDKNGQYIGGGYFTGAYGNGSYQMPTNIWGIPVYVSSAVSQGTVIVAAREAVKVWKKGGLDVRIFEQNEDDALYNRVTLLAEERLAAAVVDLNGVCIIEAGS